MSDPHYESPATLLQNGKVLVAGGGDTTTSDGRGATAELYDPSTGTWSATGSLLEPLINHTVTLLQNGKVLVAGGQNNTGGTADAELYDPTTGIWNATGSMIQATFNHTAILLQNGKVLVTGGRAVPPSGSPDSAVITAAAELYDPSTGTWSATGSMNIARGEGNTATLLQNGKVLVVGGITPINTGGSYFTSLAEIYDPNTGTWSVTGNLPQAVFYPTATLLQNGKVLVVGGETNSVELYDPNTGTWSAAASVPTPFQNNPAFQAATLLPNGTVLVTGGSGGGSGDSNSAAFYDPTTDTWSITGNMNTARYNHTATLLPNGKVLVAGGWSGREDSTAELYDAGPTVGTITVATSPTAVNTQITASAPFTYGNPTDTNTASWNWGDGNTTTGTVTESNGSGTVSDTHTYTTPGVYTITITVTDSGGGSNTATYQYIAVYDPTAGFLTGSGSIDSPAGAYPANPTATGKLHFGIDAKYKGHETTPDGNTKIDFKAVGFDFDLTSYQWLVINNDQAQLQGTGKVDGQSGYTIFVSAIDNHESGNPNGQDTIRIQITNSSGTVVYDNQMGAALTANPTQTLSTGNVKVKNQ